MNNYIFTTPSDYNIDDIKIILERNEDPILNNILENVEEDRKETIIFLFDRAVRYILSKEDYKNDETLCLIFLPIMKLLLMTAHKNEEIIPIEFDVEDFVDFLYSNKSEYNKAISFEYNKTNVEDEANFCRMLSIKYLNKFFDDKIDE